MVILSTTFTKSSVLVKSNCNVYGYYTKNTEYQFYVVRKISEQAVN